ncbi:unnamed protein product [Amoebophrya sp. A25]|nr:unnamed protein product [Amoebophrya sp. A25]|eukprot:GSA25T00017537001.1
MSAAPDKNTSGVVYFLDGASTPASVIRRGNVGTRRGVEGYDVGEFGVHLDPVELDKGDSTGRDSKHDIHKASTARTERTTNKKKSLILHNIRKMQAPPTLAREGFILLQDFQKRGGAQENTNRQEDARPIDFLDQADVVRRFYPQVGRVIRKATGASQVYPFDHNLRFSTSSSSSSSASTTTTTTDQAGTSAASISMKDKIRNTESGAEVQNPISRVHTDYSVCSAARRLLDLTQPAKMNDTIREFLPPGQKCVIDPGRVFQQEHRTNMEESDNQNANEIVDVGGDFERKDYEQEGTRDEHEETQLSVTKRRRTSTSTDQEEQIPNLKSNHLPKRFAIFNLWKSIDSGGMVETNPLGLISANSFGLEDLVVYEIQYKDRVGENWFVRTRKDYDVDVGHVVPSPTPSDKSPETEQELDILSSHISEKKMKTDHFLFSPTRWYYAPFMTYDECLLFKQWDSYGEIAQSATQKVLDLVQHKRNLDKDPSAGDVESSGQSTRDEGFEKALSALTATQQFRPSKVEKDQDGVAATFLCGRPRRDDNQVDAFIGPPGCSDFVPHSAIVMDEKASPRPRKSIEVRCFAFFD